MHYLTFNRNFLVVTVISVFWDILPYTLHENKYINVELQANLKFRMWKTFWFYKKMSFFLLRYFNIENILILYDDIWASSTHWFLFPLFYFLLIKKMKWKNQRKKLSHGTHKCFVNRRKTVYNWIMIYRTNWATADYSCWNINFHLFSISIQFV